MPDKHTTIDAYAETLSDAGKDVAVQIRAIVAQLVPEAVEAIKYNIPAFQLGGRSFIYFAVWKKHVGLYPIYRGDAAFEALVGSYRAKKDTIQFALDMPLPVELVEQIVKAQADRSRKVL
jgi:uncharacterized protein YdhG (YjbR/CyaY superfamily)